MGQLLLERLSQSTYSSMDALMYQKLWAWARRRHPNKNRHWIARKYWLIGAGEGWVFDSRNEPHSMRLFNHDQTPIKRHIKVQGSRSPYDGDWIYWSRRMGHHPTVTSRVARLLKRQTGRCAHCGLYFFPDDLMEVHHVDRNQNKYLSKINCIFFDKVLGDHFEVVAISHFL